MSSGDPILVSVTSDAEPTGLVAKEVSEGGQSMRLLPLPVAELL
jgi:hypothetical protein